MARIADQELDHLKQSIAVERLAEAKGIVLKRHGADLIGLCPFHDDHEPSLVISPQKNLWHCLGACQCGGTVIDWVMKSEGVSFRHAVELLRTDPSLAASSSPPVKHSTVTRLPAPLAADAEDQILLAQVVDYYHRTLLQSPEALAYLAKRGIADREAIETFQLGYANRTLGYYLPRKNRLEGAELRGRLQRLGLLRESGHEHFNGSLVIPVINDDHVTELYGRKIRDDLRPGTPSHLYLPGPHRGVWNRDALYASTEIILCESLIDALTFWCAGFRNVTASYGVEGFTPDHLRDFKEHGTVRVLIAYDRDAAGDSAAASLAKTLLREGFDCYRLHFPKGMDANAYALQVQPASKSLGVVIRSAQWLGQGEAPQRVVLEVREAPVIEAATKNKKSESLPALAAPAHPATAPCVALPPASLPSPAPAALAHPCASAAEAPPLPASAVPPAPIDPVTPDVTDHEVNVTYGERRYRVRGLAKNTSYDVLKVNVLVSHRDAIHVDTFDLYSAKHRQAFARVAATECGIEDNVLQRDMGQLLLQLEGLQDKAIQAALQPKEPTGYTMAAAERERALQLLHDPTLAERIITDFTKTGLVGEPTNALMGYLATVSRKLKSPLAIIVQSTSAAGKSALMDAVLKLVPEEDRVHYSAMTGQSLFYLGETNLKHKCLAIAEEEGVRQAAYALKLLQSQGELTIASTGKDPQTGKLVTEEYRVEGPVMLFLTTTAIDIDEELLNRCVVLTINESREQTAAIQQRQRQARTLSGLLASNEGEQIIQQHQNAQRLLRPLAVVNPYAEQLAFADSRTRTRRDHEKYLTLIDTITLLHQYQRAVKTLTDNGKAIEYVEVTLDDIALANQLAHDILGRSLDELPPPTRSLLQHLHTLVAGKMQAEGLRQSDVRFIRREVRAAAGLADTQVRVHLDRLVELEYVLAHYGGNGKRYVYELVFDGTLEQDRPQLIGLIDVAQLKNDPTTTHLAAQTADLAPSVRSARGHLADSSRTHEPPVSPSRDKGLENDDDASDAIRITPVKKTQPSYRNVAPLVASE